MRSVLAGIRTLVLPYGAPAGTPRLVLGPDVPAELQTYYFNAVTAVEIYYASSGFAGTGNYRYTAFFEPISGFANVAHGVYDATNAKVLEVDRINYASAGNGMLYEIGTPNGTDATVEMLVGNNSRSPNAAIESWTHALSMTTSMRGPFDISGESAATIGNQTILGEDQPVIRTSNVGTFTAETVVDTGVWTLENGVDYFVKVSQSYQSSVNDSRAVVRVRENNITGTILQEVNCMLSQVGASGAAGYPIELIAPYTAGASASKTFVVTALRGSGTGNITALGRAVAPSVVRLIRRA